MRLFAEFDDDYKPTVTVEVMGQKMDRIEWFKLLLERDKRTIGKLQTDAGLSHPRLSNVINGKSASLETILIAVLEMGYEINVVKDRSAR